MSIKAILFDLDGTLLPLDQDLFIKEYFTSLVGALAKRGYDPARIKGAVWAGTEAMLKNDGTVRNEELFWSVFIAQMGDEAVNETEYLEQYYKNDFPAVKWVTHQNPEARAIVKDLKAQGYDIILATNPVFPFIATEIRIAWAGLDKEDFSLITTYENMRHAKPNPDYYREICAMRGYEPNECLMIGNDTSDDMIAEKIGMEVFLLTDCLINTADRSVSDYRHGGFSELATYISEMNR